MSSTTQKTNKDIRFFKSNSLLYLYLNYILIYLLLTHTSLTSSQPQPPPSTTDHLNNHQQILEQYLIEKINLELSASQADIVLKPIRNINNIAYHGAYVYVGAQNWLLKLNALTLKIEQSVNYGPILDSVMCRYYPFEECTVQSKKYATDNFNKLLIVYEQRQALLTCWSARQGTCDLRDLNDLNRIIQASAIPTVANDPFNSTIGFIASAANSQDLFYTASTYTSQGPYRDDVPALSGRSLNIQQQQDYPQQFMNSNSNRFMQILTANSQGLKSSKASIDFIARFMKSFIVKYVTAFNLGIYNYFLSVQHMDTDAMLRGDLLVTKLARLCLNDLSFTKSYTEMPLRCIGTSNLNDNSLRSIDYNELINAKLIQIKSNGFDDSSQSNEAPSSQTEEAQFYLIGLFQKTSRNTFNATLSHEGRQAVCLFSIKQLQSKIKENLRKCYNSDQQMGSLNNDEKVLMRGLSFIKPDQQCSSARKYHQQRESAQINDDFCSSADNGLYPIGGQISAYSSPIVEFENSVYFDSIQAWSDSTATSLILMSQKRQEIRYFHLKSASSAPINYRIIKLSSTPLKDTTQFVPLSNLQFEQTSSATPPNMFVASENTIYKIKTSSCESFTTCNECLITSANLNPNSGGDPFCGWCNQLNECTTRAKCMQHSKHEWMNGAQIIQATNDSSLSIFNSMCVDIDSIEPAQITYKPTETEWVQINFRKSLPTSQLNSSSQYQCVYVTETNETTTEAIQITANKLKCSLPHQTKLNQLFQANLFKQNNLVLGEDGLFKQLSTIYYEQQKDQLVLPLYVQSTQLKNVRYGASNTKTSIAFNLTITDCNAHKSCISCTHSKQCQWCSNSCISNQFQSSDGICSSDSASCESFDTPGIAKLLIPYTLHRQQAPITLTLLNNPDTAISHSYECFITMFDGEFIGKNISLPFVATNKTHGQCILTNIFKHLAFLIDSPEASGQVQTNLRVYDSNRNIFVDSLTNGKLALLFYKCELKANDCTQCLSLNRQLSCMWCSNSGSTNNGNAQQSSCRFMNAQSKQAASLQCISTLFQPGKSTGFNQCEKPQILNIHPTKLPLGGGTTLIINGINLGSSLDDIIGVNLQCESDSSDSITKCDLLPNKYVPSKQIGCKTRPSSTGLAQSKCRISVKLKSNFKSQQPDLLNAAQHVVITGSQVVEFVDPIVNEIQPATIIQSANFVWLTIKGVDLDAGRTRQIQIIDYINSNEPQSEYTTEPRLVKCEIKNFSSTEIKCRINDKFRMLGKKNLKIVFDEYMSIMQYLSIRVTTDPLVTSVDKKLTMYSGGTQFTLDGFNFDSVQTAYTYVAFRDLWYSEPVLSRERISNEKIKFEYPALTDAFFDLIKQQQFKMPHNKYELQIGFLMDGFNVTLKDAPIVYVENFTQLSVKNVEITRQKSEESNFNLLIDLDSSDTLFLASDYFNLLREDLNVYIACSQCTKVSWINETRFLCRLPSLVKNNQQKNNKTCEAKVFNSILTQLNANKLNLIHIFIGNFELQQQLLFEETNENLKIYLRTYQLENVENYSNLAAQLTVMASNPNATLVATLLKQQSVLQTSIFTGLDESSTSRNLMLISSIIAGLMVMLIIFIIGIITLILKMKRKSKQFETNQHNSLALSLTHNFLKPGNRSAILSSKRFKPNRKKSEKKLRFEFEKIRRQMDHLEVNVRAKCAHLFQQLHQDYVNELNHDMIYTVGLPVWNYKTYLINILFPSSSLSLLNNLLVVNVNNGMTNSSMSNSTTNTLVSSNLTPKQQQQQQQMNSTSMSVYATIKSSNMLNFNQIPEDQTSNFKSHGHIGEAMQLFDQLLHNKTFLLTFIQVCEENSSSTFTLKDRCHLASLLTIGLKDNLPYFYSIIKTLLSDYIAKSFSPLGNHNDNVNKSKLLFRTNESLIEPLLTNWLSMFMYDFQKDTQCATHLYRLVKVIKFYLDMGPCDEQTHQAANTLNEERLLNEPVPFQTIYVNVVNKCHVSSLSTATVQICRLLDCDTINQTKEKIIDHLYKSNRSLAPTIKDVDLELCLLILNQDPQQQQKHTTTVIILRETEEELIAGNNSINQVTSGLKRLLTLKDYNIQNGSFINICQKQSVSPQTLQQQQQQQQQHVYMSTLSMNNEYLIYASNQQKPSPPNVSPPPLITNQANRYHLVKPHIASGNNMLLTFSTTTSSSSASSSTETTDSQCSASGAANPIPKLNEETKKSNRNNKKKKKYEKLLTVKSQDSGVTTASLISSNDSSPSAATSTSLTRLLINKGTLQPFVDQFVETLFSNTANLPPIIQHLFEFFDQEVKKYSGNVSSTLSSKEKKSNVNCVNDELNKLTRIWKTNSYFLRYWINMIKNPDFLMDVNKNWLIDSSLTSIAQALIDSCSSTDSHNLYDTNSPINRLLFIKEVPRYKQMIEKFYTEMQSYQPISDHELHFYLNEFSKCQQQQQITQPIGATINQNQSQVNGGCHLNSDLSSIQILLQLYEYYEKYEQQINSSLGKQQCSILLPVHHRLVQIKEHMMSQASQMIFNNTTSSATLNRTAPYLQFQPVNYNQQTLNPYQQPMNFYATTNELQINQQSQQQFQNINNNFF